MCIQLLSSHLGEGGGNPSKCKHVRILKDPLPPSPKWEHDNWIYNYSEFISLPFFQQLSCNKKLGGGSYQWECSHLISLIELLFYETFIIISRIYARKGKQAAKISQKIYSIEISIVNTICIWRNIQIKGTFSVVFSLWIFCGI